MEILLVGIGGILGSISRYGLGKMISEKNRTTFPLGTFIINISGALLLGLVSGLDVSRNMNLLIADGFLGAFTTFSTFMYEGFSLISENENLNALIYIMCSLIIGVIGFIIGLELGKFLKII